MTEINYIKNDWEIIVGKGLKIPRETLDTLPDDFIRLNVDKRWISFKTTSCGRNPVVGIESLHSACFNDMILAFSYFLYFDSDDRMCEYIKVLVMGTETKAERQHCDFVKWLKHRDFKATFDFNPEQYKNITSKIYIPYKRKIDLTNLTSNVECSVCGNLTFKLDQSNDPTTTARAVCIQNTCSNSTLTLNAFKEFIQRSINDGSIKLTAGNEIYPLSAYSFADINNQGVCWTTRTGISDVSIVTRNPRKKLTRGSKIKKVDNSDKIQINTKKMAGYKNKLNLFKFTVNGTVNNSS